LSSDDRFSPQPCPSHPFKVSSQTLLLTLTENPSSRWHSHSYCFSSLRLLVSRTPPLKPLVDFRFPNPPISQSEEKQLKGERTSIYESTVFRLGALSSKVMEDARKPLKTGNLLCKVVDLAAGEARNLILTGE